jgi:hypothetical protein
VLLVKVKAVERGGGAVGERVDALTEPVALGEFGALVGQRVALRVDLGPPGVELFGSALSSTSSISPAW